jgi:excinuclease ABC subunit B
MGRAARNVHGRVIMYADTMTRSMKEAITEAKRRRKIQAEFNREHGIVPKSAIKKIADSIVGDEIDFGAVVLEGKNLAVPQDPKAQQALLEKLKAEMFTAASKKDFERAAEIRDTIKEIEEVCLKL